MSWKKELRGENLKPDEPLHDSSGFEVAFCAFFCVGVFTLLLWSLN